MSVCFRDLGLHVCMYIVDLSEAHKIVSADLDMDHGDVVMLQVVGDRFKIALLALDFGYLQRGPLLYMYKLGGSLRFALPVTWML